MKIKWYGSPAHFICADRCRFHLTTEVGKYVVSTVGEFYPDANGAMIQVGSGRFYETMVFKVTGRCTGSECGCGLPRHDAHELDSVGSNTALEATKGHMKMVAKYSKKK